MKQKVGQGKNSLRKKTKKVNSKIFSECKELMVEKHTRRCLLTAIGDNSISFLPYLAVFSFSYGAAVKARSSELENKGSNPEILYSLSFTGYSFTLR